MPAAKKNTTSNTPVSPPWAANTAPAHGATQYDLYVGTVVSSMTITASNITATTYEYTLSTAMAMYYYWHVVS